MSVFVVGSLHLDVVVRAPHLPTLDETVTGQSVDYVFGGKGGNQAVAVARTGGDVHFAGRAGQDSFGNMLRAQLAAHEIDISQLQTDPGPSGMSAAIVDQNGEYGAVIVSAANLKIDPEPIFIPEGTSLVVLQNEVPEAVNIHTARAAKAAGAVVWLNAAPARPLSPDLWAMIDLLIVNRVEADYYRTARQEVDTLTTLGSEGVRYGGRDWPADHVDVVSTHGAGDMFVGALAMRINAGDDMQSAIPFAQSAAAWLISTTPEDRANMTPEALTDHLNNQLNR